MQSTKLNPVKLAPGTKVVLNGYSDAAELSPGIKDLFPFLKFPETVEIIEMTGDDGESCFETKNRKRGARKNGSLFWFDFTIQ